MKKLIRLLTSATLVLTAIVFTAGCSSNDLPSNAVNGEWSKGSFVVEIIGGSNISTNPDGSYQRGDYDTYASTSRFVYDSNKKEITHNGETLKVISNVNKVMTVDYSSDFTRTYDFSREKDITRLLIENETGELRFGNYYTFK
jgi:hypothetical protein